MEAVLKTRRRMSKADKGAEEEGMGRRRRRMRRRGRLRRRRRRKKRRRRVREMRPPGRVGTLSLPPLLLAGILRPVEWRTPSLPLRGCQAPSALKTLKTRTMCTTRSCFENFALMEWACEACLVS